MNITGENFESSFSTICEAIRTSHFVAIDCEFTGLRLPDATRDRSMDTIQMRYDGGRSSASSFMLTQYGVCCFRFKDEDGSLEARPFNAFVFPSTKFRTDRVFSCQSSSMDFLSKNGFDFQAWAAHGVPFLSREQEAHIQRKLLERRAREDEAAAVAAAIAEAGSSETASGEQAERPPHVTRDGTTLASLPLDEKTMILDARKKVEALLEEVSSADEYVERTLTLDPMNGRSRWLVYEFVGTQYPGVKLRNLTGPRNVLGIQIKTVSPDKEQRELEEMQMRDAAAAKEQEDIKGAAGFRRVIDVLSKAGKPVIAHNGLLDLMHTHDKFVGPLPDGHEEGTQALHTLFPSLFDNKVVMSSAVDAGLAFPQTVPGKGFDWLRETQAPTKGADNASGSTPCDSTAAEAARNEKTQKVENTDAGADNEDEGSAKDKMEVESGHVKNSAGEQPTNGSSSNSSNSSKSGNYVSRAMWEASFAPGFEERYADGGQEHEAGYDAYLTGCCFAAAATLGLGVTVEELKGMGSGDGADGGREVPEALRPVQNKLPLWKIMAGQKLRLPGPTPAPDLTKLVKVSGFPKAAQTDAIVRTLTAAMPTNGEGEVRPMWFHWIDDTSGVAEFESADAARMLVKVADDATVAAAAVAVPVDMDAVTDGDGDDKPVGGVADPLNLKLEDMVLVAMGEPATGGGNNSITSNLPPDGSGADGEQNGEQELPAKSGAEPAEKRPRSEDVKEGEGGGRGPKINRVV